MDDALKDTDPELLKQLVRVKDFPSCTLCLVIAICTCHMIVLLGNLKTAEGIGLIGTSTGGWANVGTDLSGSLKSELDVIMKNVSTMLTDAINHTMFVQDMLDTVVGLTGEASEASTGAGNATAAMLLLQMHEVPDALGGLLTNSINTVLDTLMAKIMDGLTVLMDKLKPALLAVGGLVEKVGAKVQDMLEQFSISLDSVQKIMDQVMSTGSSKGSDEDLLRETFNLFDVSNTGDLTADDLQKTGVIYSIPALQGSVADELVAKYDQDGSGAITRSEYALLVNDPKIPDCMSVALRSFAKSLSAIAGQVGGSRFRGEIAKDVAEYLELIVQKNFTKVSWISDALTNESLPIEFTSDIIVNLALKLDDPNRLPAVVTGEVVIPEMMRLNAPYASKAIDLLSNSTYWVDEGFSPDDHAEVVSRVTKWSLMPSVITGKEPMATLQTIGHEEALKLIEEKSLDQASAMIMDRRLLSVMPGVAHKLAKERMHAHLETLREKRRAKYDALYASETSQHLMLHLMGEPASNDAPVSPATQMVQSGILAHPETLKFAQFLSWNASDTAKSFQNISFAYQKTSSNAIDGFATQIQGMVKKIQSFIKTMEQYSTPDGIATLETTILGYAQNASADVLKTIKKKLDVAVEDSLPVLDDGITNAINSSSQSLADMLVNVLMSPLAEGLKPATSSIVSSVAGPETGDKIGGEIGKIVAGQIGNITGALLGQQIADLLNGLVDKGLASATNSLDSAFSAISFLSVPCDNKFASSRLIALNHTLSPADEASAADLTKRLNDALSLTQGALKARMEKEFKNKNKARFAQLKTSRDDDEDGQLSGMWEQMVAQLKSLTNVVPQANIALSFASKEVGMLAGNLESIFAGLHESGPPILNQVASLWSLAFTLYFFLIIPFPLALLFYAFWAGGYFVGPGLPEDKSELESPKPNRSFLQKCEGCYFACCYCCCGCHASPFKAELCFWSVCILMQIVVLLLFLISLVFSLLTGVKLFLAAGCAQIYLIADPSVCGNALTKLRDFLSTFITGVETIDLGAYCTSEQLLTCDLIGKKMQTSGLYTVAGSFLAALLTFQLLIQSAEMHERAVNRFKIENQIRESGEKVPN